MLRPLMPESVKSWRAERHQNHIIEEWEQAGYPLPPPHLVKQRVIREFQKRTGFKTLVETGTYHGAMVEAQKSKFTEIISIELGQDLFKKAKERFKNDTNITILQGDSSQIMPDVVKKLDAPAIFWLDGHYSEGITAQGEKDCPILEELEAILTDNKYNHVILIDDARHFVGQGDYPTIQKLTEYVKSKNGAYRVEVKHDIIRYEIRRDNTVGTHPSSSNDYR